MTSTSPLAKEAATARTSSAVGVPWPRSLERSRVRRNSRSLVTSTGMPWAVSHMASPQPLAVCGWSCARVKSTSSPALRTISPSTRWSSAKGTLR